MFLHQREELDPSRKKLFGCHKGRGGKGGGHDFMILGGGGKGEKQTQHITAKGPKSKLLPLKTRKALNPRINTNK